MSHFKQAAGSEKWAYGSRRNQQKKSARDSPTAKQRSETNVYTH